MVPQKAKQKGFSWAFFVGMYGENVMSAQMLKISLFRARTVPRLEGMRGQWSNDQG